MRIFRCTVGSQIDANGVAVWSDDRDVVEVDGRRYAASFGREYLQEIGPEWSESRADAKRAAADKVAAMGRVLLAQAERLREEADGVQA